MPDNSPPSTLQPAPQSRPSRGWRLAFGLSLAFNLAVLGVVGGAMLRFDRHGHEMTMVRDLGFGPFTEALTAEDRDALKQGFFAKAPDFRATRQVMREDFAKTLTALRADPFDPAALRAVMDRQHSRNAARYAVGQALIFDHVAAMTPAARMAFADRLEDSLTRLHDRRTHH